MKTKLILIEGIPGSGKTTFAKKISEWYQRRDIAANCYLEGNLHPADLGWNACIPLRKFNEICRKYELLEEQIKLNTVFEGDTAIIAYTQVKTDNRSFYSEMAEFEVYDGKVSDEVFFQLHYDRWNSFYEATVTKDEINIFECAFLQNHVNELLFWRNSSDDEVISHLKKLVGSVKLLSPVLIYLSQPNIEKTIRHISEERVSKEYGNWIDHCISYCENSPYGKQNNLKGFEGVLRIFSVRKELELKATPILSIPYVIIENVNNNWDYVWEQIISFLSTIDNSII